MPSVMTANRLDDGAVVYLARLGGWTENISDAAIAETEGELELLESVVESCVQKQVVICPYPLSVVVESDGTLAPMSVRERVRATQGAAAEAEDAANVPL